MDNEQVYQPDSRSMFQRCLDKLFPYYFPEQRSEFMEKGSGCGLTTENYINLDWIARLRVLVGGIIKVEVTSNTEQDPGRADSVAFVNILPPGSIPKN